MALHLARHCTSIPAWPSPRCWLAYLVVVYTVGDFQPTWCPPVASRNCRRPFICLCLAKALAWCLMTLHRPHRCQLSERNWKLTYSDYHTRTLFCSLLWFFVAIVVLEVNCYLGHVKKCNVMYIMTLTPASQLAEDADDLKTFSPILNIFFTMHLLPSRTHHSYKLRPRRHDCSLTVKSDAINFIRDSCLTLNSIYCLSTAMHGQNINFENRYIAISQRKIIRFRWNFVHSSRFWTGWTSRDQKWKRCIGQTPSCCYHKQEIRSVELAEFDRTYFLYVIKTQDNKAEFQHLLLPYKIIETQMTKS